MTGTEPATPAKSRPVLVTLPAEIDLANAHTVREKLTAAFAPGALVIADMTATRYCDSQGIRALVTAHDQATASGAVLRVVISSQAVQRVMNIMKVNTMLHIYPTIDEALPDGAE